MRFDYDRNDVAKTLLSITIVETVSMWMVEIEIMDEKCQIVSVS